MSSDEINAIEFSTVVFVLPYKLYTYLLLLSTCCIVLFKYASLLNIITTVSIIQTASKSFVKEIITVKLTNISHVSGYYIFI